MYFPPLPKLKRSLAEELFDRQWQKNRPGEEKPKICILAIRGYRAHTIGNPDRNDVNEVDDLLAYITPTEFYAVNANTDPSRLGWNPGVGKPYGMLEPGVWDFYRGPHKGVTPAYRQADNAEVAKKLGIRNDGKFLVKRMWGWTDPRNYLEWGHQQVNIHPMSISSTSSWLCLTIPVDQSKRWLQWGWDQMDLFKQKTIPVALIDGPVN